MDRAEVVLKINAILSEGFELDPVRLTPEVALFGPVGLGLDSLDAIDMLVHLEDKLGIRVDAQRFRNVRVLGDVHELVWNLASESGRVSGSLAPPAG